MLKKGLAQRMFSWAAKRRCSEPTTSVTMEELKLLKLIVTLLAFTASIKVGRGGSAYLVMIVSSLKEAEDDVAGLRWRDSWRFFVMPLSLLKELLKEEVDFDTLWLLEKLRLEASGRLENMASPLNDRRQIKYINNKKRI